MGRGGVFAVHVPLLSRFRDQEEDEYEVGNGPFADILRPHEMQPIYLLPLTNGLKQLLTFSVFGFDFKTKIKTGSAAKKVAGFFVSYVAKLAFICLALNSYVRDIQTFQRSRVYHPSFWQSSLLLLAVWCTSHNFSAALGLWGSFEIQSPRVIFAKDIERERYFSAGHLFGFFKIGFPFFLGGARWLQFPKQIYAILLVPYVLPYLLLYYSTIMLLGLWAIIFTKCMCTLDEHIASGCIYPEPECPSAPSSEACINASSCMCFL